jgi:hypothetical protein
MKTFRADWQTVEVNIGLTMTYFNIPGGNIKIIPSVGIIVLPGGAWTCCV